MSEKGKILESVGVIAIVYGLGAYLVTNLSWPEYGAWGAGGVILLLIGWAKKSMESK
ncbi:MAG: hypothetical protein AAB675_02575 [Patescibacteria group bacterium]